MKKVFFLLVPVLVLMSSCMNVTEKINIKSDGSGSYAFEMDVSQTLTMMESMDQAQADSLRDVYSELANEENEFTNIPGVSNAKNSFDRTTGVYATAFDFSNTSTLHDAWKNGNSAINSLGETKPTKGFKTLTVSKKTYTLKLDLKEFRSGFEETSQEEIDMAKTMMENSNYSIELHFDRPVSSFKGLNLTKGADNKSVIFTLPIADLLYDENLSTVNLSVKLK